METSPRESRASKLTRAFFCIAAAITIIAVARQGARRSDGSWASISAVRQFPGGGVDVIRSFEERNGCLAVIGQVAHAMSSGSASAWQCREVAGLLCEDHDRPRFVGYERQLVHFAPSSNSDTGTYSSERFTAFVADPRLRDLPRCPLR